MIPAWSGRARRILILAVLSLLAATFSPRTSAAQNSRTTPHADAQARVRAADSTTMLAITLRDGSTLIGRVTASQGDSVRLRTSVGTVAFAVTDVTRATVIREQDIVDGQYWFASPNTTRLLFGPTGRMLKRGSGYFSDHMIFLPGVSVGVADRVSLGGGMSVIPGVSIGEQLFYAMPKFGIVASPKLNVAAGAMVLRLGFDDDDQKTFGVGYVVSTFGGENGSVTAGLGYGFADGKLADNPAFMLGGEKRVSNRISFVTENYLFPGGFEGTLVSGGIRFLGEKISADVGFGRVVGDRSNQATIPYVGLLVNF